MGDLTVPRVEGRDGMIYCVSHTTEYRYQGAASLCHNTARLTPRATLNQRVLRHALEIEPRPALQRQLVDYFGNVTHYFSVEGPHEHLTITASSWVAVDDRPSPTETSTISWEDARRGAVGGQPSLEGGAPGSLSLDALEFTFPSPLLPEEPAIAEYARASFPPGRPLLEAVTELNQRIHDDFRYSPGSTAVDTPLRQAFSQRQGVCQDFAHVAVACLRSLGLAARYVSGYLRTVPPPGQERLRGADASHAWFAVFCPDTGWVDFDPTNAEIPGEGHITVCWGRDYGDVAPLCGVFIGGGASTISVAVDVLPRDEEDAEAPAGALSPNQTQSPPPVQAS